MPQGNPVSGEIYRHFKGNDYRIIDIAIHSETREKMVVYQAMYGDYGVYVRPFDMFTSQVDHVKYPQVTQRYRFSLLVGGRLVEEPYVPVQEAYVPTQEQYVPVQENTILAQNTENIRDAQMPGASRFGSIADEIKVVHPYEGVSRPTMSYVEESEDEVDPILLEFLDTDDFDEKYKLLVAHAQAIDNKLIDAMAASLDITINPGNVDTRLGELRSYLRLRSKFQGNRFRR